ncbi:agamous-like MADS-box protein AGL65 [Brassica rapa]|uniref:agamous-like MADS-box protein AGL65 n=1 Tax=Brassica campestris TaxID=3711 RepID=UPI0004F18D40|nr:agamous-like MADS-box protein AGL65 [Brassica rapa]XP_022547570.2 agamous-like MADS-box protein AGL65 isoform X1 [Brassica napus]
MGRKKIELKKIECPKEKSSKYSKRKKGLLKKAEEMAVLCDSDIILLVFSPTSKPNLFYPHSRPLGRILERLSNMSEYEREERRSYTKKTLMKLFKNKNPNENHNHSSGRDEVQLQEDDKVIELGEARELLDENTSILRNWQDPHRVDDLARLTIMEDHLVSILSLIKKVQIEQG